MRILKLIWLLPRNLLIAPILVWRRFISPLYGDVCRYYPSCSTYGLGAIQNLGVIRGFPATVWRIIRCNPWSAGGIDDIPSGPAWIQVGRLGFVSPASSRRGS